MAADPANPVSATGNLDFYHFENFVNSIRGRSKIKFTRKRSAENLYFFVISPIYHKEPAAH